MIYKLLQSGSSAALTRDVNEHLAEGWKLYGYLCVSQLGDGAVFVQAVIKEDEEKSVPGVLAMGAAHPKRD